MSETAYPTEGDLQQFLIATGLVANLPVAPFAFLDLQKNIDAARSSFEGRIGRPVLAVEGTRTFDPPAWPRRHLPVISDLALCETVTVNGAVNVLNQDYFLLPENNDEMGKPFNIIEFAVPIYGPRKCISVTGKWGYGVTIHERFWNAMLNRGAFLCYGQLAAGIAKGVVSWKNDDTSASYGEKPLEYLRAVWDCVYEDACTHGAKTTVFLGG